MAHFHAVVVLALWASASAQVTAVNYPPINPYYPRIRALAPRRCAIGNRYQCGGIGQCIPQPNLCRGVGGVNGGVNGAGGGGSGGAVNPCRVGVCQNSYPSRQSCRPSTHFQCGNNNCLPRNLMCNGYNDCGDMSDESQCFPHGYGGFGGPGDIGGNYGLQPYNPQQIPSQVSCDANTQFTCYRPPHPYNPTARVVEKCIPNLYRCNRHKDCTDGSDEQNCPATASPACDPLHYHSCSNGQCVPKSGRDTVVCDRRPDCSDGSDELGCTD